MNKMTRRKTRKNTYQRRTTTQQTSSPIAWLLGGILIGIVIPSFFLFKSHLATTSAYKAVQEKSELSLNDKSESKKNDFLKHSHSKNEQTKSQHPQYDFYNLLSKSDDSKDNGEDDQQIQESKFVVEISSFKNFSQADQLKAQLSLMGIDSVAIEKQSPTAKNQLAYKVVAGPFNSRSEALTIQQQLRENDIKSNLNKSIDISR
jgi:cell division protein FtsN